MAQGHEYTVGRGRPPLHTQFKKGQSGNPSGKPGPAKLVKQRFERALCAALEGSLEDLERVKPDSAMAAVARRIALDATAGRVPAQRLLLSALDASVKAREAEEITLVQGNGQGSLQITMDEVVEMFEEETRAAVQSGYALWEASLVQGKKQGSAQTNGAEVSAPAATDEQKGEAGPVPESAAPVSLVQGKKQGSLEKEAPPKRECPPDGSHYNGEPFVVNGGAPPWRGATREQLMSSAAAFANAT